MTSRTQDIFILGATTVVGLSGPPLAAFSRGGFEHLFAPQTLAASAITAVMFYSTSYVWSRVAQPDEEREALEADARNAEDRFDGVVEDGSSALTALQEEADDEINRKSGEIEAAYSDAPEAVTHLEIEIPRYLEAWRADQDIAEGAIAEGFGEMRQLVDGRDVELPKEMAQRPNLSQDWSTPHAIATTDWRKLLEDRRSDIAEMRVEVPKSQARIQQAYDVSLAAFDSAVERLREELRFNTMKNGSRALPKS